MKKEYNKNEKILDCGIEKEYVMQQIKSVFEIDRFMRKDIVKFELLKFDSEDIVDKILKYAVESGMIEIDGDYYLCTN